jgi:hypothetical protein
MSDFNIRSDSVDVEQIMAQIRARIQEKRGVDYTEDQIRELATVRLEKFLDPRNLRSELLEQFKRSRPGLPEPPKEPPPIEPPYVFDDETLFRSHRGPLRVIRRLLQPLLKLFFNPNTLNQVLHTQAQFNVDLLKRDQRRKIEMQMFDRSRAEWNVLYYEVLHNLVLETTRNGIELKNLRMRLEALASRLDFSERRVRALEGVVQYRPEIVRPRYGGSRDGQARVPQGRVRDEAEVEVETDAAPSRPEPAGAVASNGVPGSGGESGSRRRRRRRRGRRGLGGVAGTATGAIADQSADAAAADDDFDPGDESEPGSAEDGAFEPDAREASAATTDNADNAAQADSDPEPTRSSDPQAQ